MVGKFPLLKAVSSPFFASLPRPTRHKETGSTSRRSETHNLKQTMLKKFAIGFAIFTAYYVALRILENKVPAFKSITNLGQS